MKVVNNNKNNPMKKSSYVMCAMLIAFCTVFVSCEQEVKDAPTIKFTYNGEVKNNEAEVDAKVGDEITIIAEYEALGKISQIFLRAETEYRVYVGTAQAYDFDKKTNHKITETIKFEDAGDVRITTSISDQQKDALKANFEMKVKVR